MKRLLAATSAVLLFSTLAFAVSVHFKPRDPQFLDQGLTLLMTGDLAGLGNFDVTVIVTAVGIPEVLCRNHGGNAAPGQNPGETTVSGAVSIPASEIKNGTVFVSVATQPPPNPDPAVACPNANWSAVNIAMEFSSATVMVLQNNVIVLQETFEL